MPDDARLRILITFAIEPELVGRIRAVDPARIDVDVLGSEQRRLLRGVQYPSASERANVAAGLHGAFAHADVVFGFWGAELHRAFTDAGSIVDVAPRLRWIQLTSAGADRLLSSGFIEGGIVVTTVSGLHATPIGEYVLCVMLMFAKGAPNILRAQQRHEWLRSMPTELRGKTVGIIGMGHIGEEVARLAKAFGCRIIATRRSVVAPAGDGIADELLPPSGLPRLLETSDYVVLAVPLTPETQQLIGEAELARMRPMAVLINIARGAVVDERALVRALQEKRIGGAALDVFDPEPLSAESPLWDMENVIVSPHISGGTEIYNERAVEIFTDNLGRYLSGEPLRNVVDPARGY
ncbi:MAG: D-2-hydroxyacid dehydrogenase [Dehalococcoidia bacterium]|nr:D-2-hydroxyacid dehydrogenase [Dehalococcoidia bacterium]